MRPRRGELHQTQAELAARPGFRARCSLAAWHAWTSPLVQTWAHRVRRTWPIALFAWFAWQTKERISLLVTGQFPVGIDARIYYRGVMAWLHGGNPWDALVAVGANTYHYAGSPVTTVLLAPAGLLSEEAFTAAWLVLTWVAAGWTLRRLHLPIWWLLFPPISEALFSGNPQLIVLALILADRSWLAALGTALKVYAFFPLVGEGRWRAIGFAVLVNGATVLIAPGLWARYLALLPMISGRLEYESGQGFSAFYFPALLVAAVVALIVLALRNRRVAGWLAVPAIWPASQFHYSTMAMPVISPLLAVFLAIPTPRLPPQVIVAEVVRRLLSPFVTRQLDRWRAHESALDEAG